MPSRSRALVVAVTAALATALMLPAAAHAAVTQKTVGGTVDGPAAVIDPSEIYISLSPVNSATGLSYEAKAESNGTYFISGVDVGKYRLTIRADGGLTSPVFVRTVTVTSDPGDIDLPLIRYTAVVGTVTGGGAALVGVTITDSVPSDSGYPANIAHTNDDAIPLDGSYRMLVLPDNRKHVLRFEAPGTTWATQYFSGAVSKAAAKRVAFSATRVVTANAHLVHVGVMRGKLSLPAGATAADRTVVVYDASGHYVTKKTTPASGSTRGSFAFTTLAAGTYRLGIGRVTGAAHAAGTYYRGVLESTGTSSAAKIKVVGGKVTSLGTITVSNKSAGSLTGSIYTVKSGKHLPRKGLRVTAVPKGGSSATSGATGWGKRTTRLANTSKSGAFALRGLSPGTYVLYVWNSSNGTGTKKKLGTYIVKKSTRTKTGPHRFDTKTRG